MRTLVRNWPIIFVKSLGEIFYEKHLPSRNILREPEKEWIKHMQCMKHNILNRYTTMSKTYMEKQLQ